MFGGSNYPPGVTGNEPQIVGYPECGNCGHEAEAHDQGDYPHEERCTEEGCECREYDQYGDAYDEPPGYDSFHDPPSYAR